MFGNVLIGVDGHQGGRDAIALARGLAAPGAKLTLAHITFPPIALGFGQEREGAAPMLVAERRLAAVDAEIVVETAWSVGGGLHYLADEIQADLLVVGSSRHPSIGRVLLGDDCVGALDAAPCATAIATLGAPATARPWTRIGVGYDGSPESDHALDVAREIARVHGAQLKAFHVVSLPEVSAERPLPADWPRALEELIERNAQRLAALGGVEAVVTYGGPGEELAQFGRGVDLMIVGSRGFGPVRRLLHGSVSHYLVRHAECPLLILPPQATEADNHHASGAASTVLGAGS